MIYFLIMIGSFILCEAGCGDGDADDPQLELFFLSKYPVSQPASNGWVFCRSCPAINFAFYPLLLAGVNYFSSNKLLSFYSATQL